MSLTEETRHRIDGYIKQKPVVLFMKGSRRFPQCGFSAKVVQILDSVVDEYDTVDVLSDPSIRDGIKAYSDWPTIPQLYVNGEFMGGCDIVTQMFETGELQKKLGVEPKSVVLPDVTVTPAAAKAIAAAQSEAGDDALHLGIDGRFQHTLDFSARTALDVEVDSKGIKILLDPASAKRANGLVIDFVEGPHGSGFKIENPNAPAAVKQLSVQDLKKKLDAGDKPLLLDVRTESERETAKLEAARLLDDACAAEIDKLDKNTPLYFMCHHGGRSQRMAEQYRQHGFRHVYNIIGGIDAWSQHIDSTVPRY